MSDKTLSERAAENVARHKKLRETVPCPHINVSLRTLVCGECGKRVASCRLCGGPAPGPGLWCESCE